MADITMKPGGIYSLRVVRKEADQKRFTRGGKPVVRHNIYLQDPKNPDGEFRTEFVSESEAIPLNVLIEGVIQLIRCKTVDPRGNEIEPVQDNEDQQRQFPITRQTLPTGAADGPSKQQVNCNDKNISGKSSAFAFAYVKDLFAKEIELKPAGWEIDEAFIERYIQMAGKVESGICELLNF